MSEVGAGAIFDPSLGSEESKAHVRVRARTDCRLAVVRRADLDDDALHAVAAVQVDRLRRFLRDRPGR